jgi:hypothetical protein
MNISDERVAEFKEIFRKEYSKELSDSEARGSAENLVRFFELLWECQVKDLRRKRRLKQEPDGFPLDTDCTCAVCRRTITGSESWYSRWGITCLPCYRAIKEGVVPGFICRSYNSFYRVWQLKDKFGIHPQTARKLIRDGKIRARILLNDDGKPYEYVILKKENLELIDPERHSPARKSYDRNRDKVSGAIIREEKRKLRAERARLKGKR